MKFHILEEKHGDECAEQSSHCPVGDLLKDGDK